MQLKKILVPYDITPNNEKVIKKVFSLIEGYHSKILLLTCIRDKATFGFFKTKFDKREIEKEKNNVKKHHAQIINEATKLGITIMSKIIKSDLESQTIIKYAKDEKVDLIVMCRSKKLTHAERMYYDSTVDAVFTKTPCPFLYIP
ncbi:universal stress protein [Nitrosopumilus sp. S4]